MIDREAIKLMSKTANEKVSIAKLFLCFFRHKWFYSMSDYSDYEYRMCSRCKREQRSPWQHPDSYHARHWKEFM